MSYPRRQPCPCGSGKQYRKCCELNQHKELQQLEAAHRLARRQKASAMEEIALEIAPAIIDYFCEEVATSSFTINDGYVSYIGQEQIVKIPKEIDGQSVIGIAARGFEQSNVLAISIPETVKEIGKQAFDGCTELLQVELVEGLEKIGRWAFQGCHSLKQVTIPSTVSYIDGYAFDECRNLVLVDFLGEVEHIGAYAFSETDLRTIKLPHGLKFIANSLFYNCTQLQYVDMPETVEKILMMPFAGCTSLQTVILPGNLKEISAQAFEGCAIDLLIMPNQLPGLLKNSFANCEIHKVYAPYTGNQKVGILDTEHSQLLQFGVIESVADCLEKYPDAKLEHYSLRPLLPANEWNIMRGESFAKYRDKTKQALYEKYGWVMETTETTEAAVEAPQAVSVEEPNAEEPVEVLTFDSEGVFEFEDEALTEQQEEETTDKDLYVETLTEGYYAKHRGEIDLAIEKYKEAISFKPHINTAYYNLGKVLYIKGEYESAIRSYKIAISLGQELYDALRHIGHALLDETMKDSFYKDVVAFYKDGLHPHGRMQNMLAGNYQFSQPSSELSEEYDRICIHTAERLLAMIGEKAVEDHS